MTQKKGISLKSPDIQNNREKYKDKTYEYYLNNNTRDTPLSKEDLRRKPETILKKWLSKIIKDKLERKSFLSSHIHKPICLYRKSIEENETAVEEEVTFVTGKHIVHMVYAYGGFIPSSFQTIDIYTIDAFTKWLVQERKKDLLLQYLEVLE